MCVATSLFIYNRAKERMKSTPVAAGIYNKVGPQNDGEKEMLAVAKKMNYRKLGSIVTP